MVPVNDLDLFANAGDGQICDDPTLVPGVEGHIYLVEFGPARIKVGRTASPKARIAAHVRAGRQLDRPVTRLWVSPPHSAYCENERALLRTCREFSGFAPNWRGEYFPIEAERVMSAIAALPLARASSAEVRAFQQRVENTTNALKGFLFGGWAS